MTTINPGFDVSGIKPRSFKTYGKPTLFQRTNPTGFPLFPPRKKPADDIVRTTVIIGTANMDKTNDLRTQCMPMVLSAITALGICGGQDLGRGLKVFGLEVESGISHQPFGLDEIKKGLDRRLRDSMSGTWQMFANGMMPACVKKIGGNRTVNDLVQSVRSSDLILFFAIESGGVEDNGGLHDTALITLTDRTQGDLTEADRWVHMRTAGPGMHPDLFHLARKIDLEKSLQGEEYCYGDTLKDIVRLPVDPKNWQADMSIDGLGRYNHTWAVYDLLNKAILSTSITLQGGNVPGWFRAMVRRFGVL